MSTGGRDTAGGPVDPEVLHDVLLELTQAVEERFGEQEPTPQELDDFLRKRLLAQGHSDEEASRILSGLEE